MWLIVICKLTLKPILRIYYRIKDVRIQKGDLEKQRQLRGRRVVFVSNHVDRRDAIVAFYISKALRDRFYFMSNREQLSEGTLYTWILRSCGVYSIARGLVDIASIKYTTRLLSGDERNRLFFFPEGGAFSRNDAAFPFLIQPFDIILRSAKLLRTKLPDETIFVVPVALRYEYEGVDREIASSLERLEKAVGIPISSPEDNFAKRLMNVGTAVVQSFARTYEIELPPESVGVHEIALRIKQHVVNSLYTQLDLASGKERRDRPAPECGALDSARAALNELYAMNQSVRVDEDSQPRSEYERLLRQQSIGRMDRVYDEAKRLENWIALDANYFRDSITTNKIVDTIIRFEREVFGEVRWSAERVCAVRLGDAIDTRGFSEGRVLAGHCLDQIVTLLGEGSVQ